MTYLLDQGQRFLPDEQFSCSLNMLRREPTGRVEKSQPGCNTAGMAGIKKEPGPTARRVAEALRRIRRGQEVTTAELSRRLAALGQPVPDTSITKTEAGTRRVDVDDLPALALALGVTPNTLLLPEVSYLGNTDAHLLTPAASGTAEQLWQWAQGERPLHMRIPGADAWLGDGDLPALRFSMRTRPYLTALHPPGTATGPPGARDRMQALVLAVLGVLGDGASGAEVRRAVEMTIALPVVMPPDEIREHVTRNGGEGS
jgi:transcriptional regulator with XRE-family HTH domain